MGGSRALQGPSKTPKASPIAPGLRARPLVRGRVQASQGWQRLASLVHPKAHKFPHTSSGPSPSQDRVSLGLSLK